MKNIVVLKSMRTLAGANDWIKAFAHKYAGQGELKVVGTDALKSFGLSDIPEVGLPNHVILEQDLSPVVEVIKEGEFGDIVRAMISAGFMEVGASGPCLTAKWYELLDKFVAAALKDSLKNTDASHKLSFSGEVSEEYEDAIKALGVLMKAVEDAEKLAKLSPPAENAEFGHDNPDAETISDEAVHAATQKLQGHKDLNQVQEESISDEEVDSATHSRDVKKSSHGKEPNEVTQEDVQGTGEPVALQDEDSAHAVQKAIESNLSSEDILNTTFKSLAEARAWKNPAPELYEVVPTTMSDKRKYGKNKAYIVKERKTLR